MRKRRDLGNCEWYYWGYCVKKTSGTPSPFRICCKGKCEYYDPIEEPILDEYEPINFVRNLK